MRVLIVDDEPLAQTTLADILSARSDVEHFDSANDASEALEKLATDSYDVLLLDINMLGLSGTELVDQPRERNLPLPSIVFVTAHVEHAVAAFEKCTVDYVLKPFSTEQINGALDRASRRTEGERAVKLIEALPQLRRLSSRPLYTRVAIRAGAQTTTRGRPDRTCGNSVLPRRRLAESPDEIPFPAAMPSMHPRRPRGKSAAPTESPVHPVPDSKLDTARLGCEAKKNIHLRLRR
jgi:CheY-like chemotaxis protein